MDREENNYANLITVNDMVLVYVDEKRQFLIQILEHMTLSSDYGEMKLDEVVGKPYGYTGTTHLGHKFYCLKPSTSDIMFKARRTTTIVYPKDLGYLLLETAVGPGSRVIDIGTGSGVLAFVLAKFVAPDGMVYSYERREDFVENARKNIQRAGYEQYVTLHHRDVEKEGFIEHGVDAIFIDVPEPWTIVPHAVQALKPGYHVVSWSPHVEQVKRTVEVLKEHRFQRIKICELNEREILARERGVRPRERGITHTAYLVRAQKVLTEPQG